MSIDPHLLAFTKSDVFTPDDISKKMASYLSPDGTLLEPAVGTGNLLKGLDLARYNRVDLYDIKGDYLAACPKGANITAHEADFLTAPVGKYKNIILNPPFVRYQDLSLAYRAFLKETWPLLRHGNLDLYYAFLLKGLSALTDDGVMVAITPNSFIYNKSARHLRQHFLDQRVIQEIIDYKSVKVFKGVSTYCCITVFSRTPKTTWIYNGVTEPYPPIPSDGQFWAPTTGIPAGVLGDICTIRNGLATLRDKIFIHDTKGFDEPCWQPVTTGPVDKWVIYPYTDQGVILSEDVLAESCPQTYAYLLTQKAELAKRDKGLKTYPAWYAFGRSQALQRPQAARVIYLPTFADPANMKYYPKPSMLFIGCFCIEPVGKRRAGTDPVDRVLAILKRNEALIAKACSPRGGGWINLSTNSLKQIPL
jgi:hypothetical protein